MASGDPPQGVPFSGLQVNRTLGSQRLEMKEILEIARKAHLAGGEAEAIRPPYTVPGVPPRSPANDTEHL